MFEAIHGSAPSIIEEGIGEYANPSSIIQALEMLLRHIGMADKADKLSAAVNTASTKVNVTGNRDGATCAQLGDAVVAQL